MYGSQTGSAEGLARSIAKESTGRGFKPVVLPLNSYDKAGLEAGGKAIIVSSTWGDGDPPDNATAFWQWLQRDTAPRLENLQFAVLGLGDRNYPDFCGASRKFDTRLEELGAKRLMPRGECDVDYEPVAKEWLQGLWSTLLTPASKGPARTAPAVEIRNGAVTGAATDRPYGRQNPFPARLKRVVRLSREGSAKDVRHVEISLEGGPLTYEPGDALGVLPENCPSLVAELIQRLGADPAHPVLSRDAMIPLATAMRRHLDITKPSQALLRAVAAENPDGELARLMGPDSAQALRQWLWGRQLIDLVGLFRSPPAVEPFVAMLGKLAPRLYSISSSPRAHPGEVHLTVGVVRYEAQGRPRGGVASTHLADRVGPGGTVHVFVQPSHGFKPPPTPDTPMIMVGPGTGIAPFRAFLEERQAAGARGSNWLFFGDQHQAVDFLYQDEIETWKASGLLTRLDLAFSRDQERKLYVQDRMLEHAPELWAWLEKGAHFYVCGDASRMARDVHAALHKVIETAGGRTPAEAEAYVAQLSSDKRYQRDVY
jgi:sulfite reductase (NADPH) flavoprotein alpha-component